MTVSRKSPGGEFEQQWEDYEMTTSDYADDKQACQERSGYEKSDTEMSHKAVDEKLPGGSQDY